MATIEMHLCVLVAYVIAVQSVELINEGNATSPRNFPGHLDRAESLPFENDLNFPPRGDIFGSWGTPDFHVLVDLPPIMIVPNVEVFCDDSKLALLVDKSTYFVELTGEEMWLGDGCYRNGELTDQFVFTYSVEECGTTMVMQNGFKRFTNILHLNLMNLKDPIPTWWKTLSTIHISCIPKRPYVDPSIVASMILPDKIFDIKAKNPSWTGPAETFIYERDQVVNLQVSAKIRPGQQLFLQSCFVSASLEPHTRPRHAVIMNKGCTVPVGSPHAVSQFAASNRPDVVNFVLNTSYFISELYVHCNVLVSHQTVTSGSKSCNYNVIKSRWEALAGSAEACQCCSSKCKGLPLQHLSTDARAVVSYGPLIIVDTERRHEPLVSELPEASSPELMQLDAAPIEEIVSRHVVPRNMFPSPSKGVVVVSNDPFARLTLWLPGETQDAGHSKTLGSEFEDSVELQSSGALSNHLPELQHSSADHNHLLNTPTDKITHQNLNVLTPADWIIPPHLEKFIAEESKLQSRLGRFGLSGKESHQELGLPLPEDMTENILIQNDYNQTREEISHAQIDADVMPHQRTNVHPVIRSKLQFSKGVDGSQTLSYEEEVVRLQEEGGMGGLRSKVQSTKMGLRAAFMDLLRTMDKAE